MPVTREASFRSTSMPLCESSTPAHDFNDYAVGMRHRLEPLNIFTLDAKVNDNAPPRYRGLPRYCSEFLVREEGGWESLEETFGHRFGWMAADSQSGFNAPRAHLAQFASAGRPARGPWKKPSAGSRPVAATSAATSEVRSM